MKQKTLPLLTRMIGFSKGLRVEDLYLSYKTAESEILEIEGMPLHYRVTGKGPALLLIHGVTSSLHTWNGWHEQLSANFRVISFCVPSFGLTGPHPKGDYSLEMYMRVIDALLEHLQVDTCFVAGNSFGGYLTWNYALHQPDRVQKIVLIDAAGISSDPKDLKNVGFKLFLNPLTKKVAHNFTPRPILKQSLHDVYGDKTKVTEDLVDRYYHMLLRKGNRKGFTTVLGKTILHGEDNLPKIKAIKQPTLILWGDRDRLIRLKDAHAFESLIEGAQLIVYKGVGHIPMEEIPKQSAADAQAFLV